MVGLTGFGGFVVGFRAFCGSSGYVLKGLGLSGSESCKAKDGGAHGFWVICVGIWGLFVGSSGLIGLVQDVEG